MGSAQIAALSSGLHDSLLEGDGFELPVPLSRTV